MEADKPDGPGKGTVIALILFSNPVPTPTPPSVGSYLAGRVRKEQAAVVRRFATKHSLCAVVNCFAVRNACCETDRCGRTCVQSCLIFFFFEIRGISASHLIPSADSYMIDLPPPGHLLTLS